MEALKNKNNMKYNICLETKRKTTYKINGYNFYGYAIDAHG
jgi:hypothetical protein